jgi:nucleotide-binding universal stress UspA family protein
MKRENQKQFGLSRPGQFVELAPRAYPLAGNPSRPARGTILHPTDYSGASRHAFELACRIARDCGSRLIVLHVAEPVWIPTIGMAPVPPLPKGYRGAWESRLRLMQPRDPTVPVEHRLEEGDPAAAILRVAREVHSDLVVMSGRERTWLGRLLTGSVTEEVERKAPCPVLRLNTQRLGQADSTAGGDSRGGDGIKPGGSILHPTDFSQPARHGFEVARSLARDSGSELIVAHVAHASGLHRKKGHRDEIEAALRRMVGSDPTVRARWVLRADDPAAGILRMVREGWCDLIVMGTGGRTGLRRLFARGVAAKVRRDAGGNRQSPARAPYHGPGAAALGKAHAGVGYRLGRRGS